MIIGNDKGFAGEIKDWAGDIPGYAVCIGNPHIRKKVVETELGPVDYCLLINGSAQVSPSAILGRGCVITAGCIITCNVILGNHVIVNLNSTIGHNSVIGDYTTISPGVNISGDVKIGSCCYIGSNASIKEGVSICDNTIIGMGGVVIRDIIKPGTYVSKQPIKVIHEKSERKRLEVQKSESITDGFENYFPKYCPDCGKEMQIMRPGDARCPICYDKLLDAIGIPEKTEVGKVKCYLKG